HAPRIRGRLYSSCASSTCSFPSALTACWAKMSRISCVRSTTRACSASSRRRCCGGASSSSTSSTSAPDSPKALFSASSLPLPTYVRGSGAARCWTSSATGSTPAVRASSRSSPSSSSASTPWPSTATTNPRSGSEPGDGSGWCTATTAIMPSAMAASDLAARTLELVDVPSESRRERALMDLARILAPGPVLYDDGECLLVGDADASVVLAGHIDTIPAQGNLPGRIDDGAVHGLGASDMKGGIAVMLELARAGLPARYLFFTREEVPLSESPLPALFTTDLLDGVELAVVLEPTDCILHGGCL